ncbi:MAG: peptidylprolyl isomerase [Deltaproteobacteria bacterium]|jgi:FKBP-type peptidyl-prolyl cis-trans isomerase 2|nr:peptidylprolyl isomerase [Deltaproteobacteria bacterium]
MNKAQDGDTVTVVFQGLLEDGSVFDSSDEEEPLVFVLGTNEVLPGFERAVNGMTIGEQKTVTLPPEEGYGVHQAHLIEQVDIGALPGDLNLQIGNQLEVTAEDGDKIRLMIIDRDDNSVTLDANHPLAGRTLTFRIELMSIDRPTIN